MQVMEMVCKYRVHALTNELARSLAIHSQQSEETQYVYPIKLVACRFITFLGLRETMSRKYLPY
jgi:hypothetical protein